MSNVTRLIDAAAAGDPQAAADLLPLVYAELRKLAEARLTSEKPGQTLQATALVHEAYLRLVGSDPGQPWNGRGHFFAAAAEAMRRILVEAARRKGRHKHGGDHRRVDLDAITLNESAHDDDDLVALREALDGLATASPQAAELVKLRFFAGFTGHQAAELLGVSPRKGDQLWAYARAWLLDKLADPRVNSVRTSSPHGALTVFDAEPPMTEQSLFAQVLDIPDPADRAAFLDGACGGDTDLRQRLERLLSRHQVAGSFLDRSPVMPDETRPFAPAEPAESPGTRIGPYHLLEVIGEGGMGTVYMAEQSAPVRRKVALKVIKPGMDSKQVVARFEAERQALALMDHPHIARVFDGGATPSGRPYFVMELVRGLPVTDFCDQAKLTVPERLGLFVHACRAVQHAHQKGVIHRDIKPSNVLVTVIDGKPVPKVIDFGIAKATGAALTDRTLFTGFHQLVGTPLYMSPEQAELSGVDVDTRSDVYSLGVLLYELLTGTTPFSPETFRTAGLDEMRRIIREEEPPRPSRRVSTLAAAQSSTIAERRKLDPRRLDRLMRSELDWVVMRALEKDRNRRYDGAGGLAADVERYLADEPVQAAPPTVVYRLRKFARRHRAGLTLGAVVAAAVLAIGGSVGWGLWDWSARRATAKAAATTALDESAEHYRADRPEAAMASAKRAVDTLADVPGAGRSLADARRRVADLEMAERLEDLQLAGLESGDGSGADGAAATLQEAFREYGIDPIALSEAESAERIGGRLISAELVEGLDLWAAARRTGSGRDDPLAKRLGGIASAADPDPWSRRVRAARAEATPDQLVALAAEIPLGTAPPSAVPRLCLALDRHGRRAEAEALLRRAARHYPDTLMINFLLADLLRGSRAESRNWESLGYYQAALAVRPRSAVVRDRIGALFTDRLNRPAEGTEWFREVLRLKPDYHMAKMNLSVALGKQGKHAEALVVIREAVAATSRADMYHQLGLTLGRLGRSEEAAEAYRTVLEFEPHLSGDHVWRGMSLAALGRTDEAIATYREVIRLSPADPRGYERLGSQLSEKGDDAEAVAVYQRGIEVDPNNALLHSRVGVLSHRQGRTEQAVAAFREAVRLEPKTPAYHFNLGKSLNALKRVDDAAAAYRKAIESDPNYPEAHCNLAELLVRRGRYPDALAAYQRGHELGSKQPSWGYPSAEWVETARRLVALEPRLPAILVGTETPTDPADAAAAAKVAALHNRSARAAELYGSAVTADPLTAADPKSGRRFAGACAAAQAGCGLGEGAADLDGAARAKWRNQSLEWLKAELAAREKSLAGGSAVARRAALSRLRGWQSDGDLAGVRDGSGIAKLPEAERGEWTKFWADVQATLDSGRKPAAKKD